MIEAAAWRIAKHIKAVVPNHPAPIENLNHSLIISINFFTVIGLAVLGALFTGHGKDAAVMLLAFAVLRQLTGGLHLESSTWCAVATAGTATLLSLVTLDQLTTTVLTVIGLLCVMVFAPAGIEDQTIIPERYYPILKVVGMFIIASNFWVGSSFAAIAYFAQGIMLAAYVLFKGGEKLK
ncbi:accessory gene regulator B family protein [Paenibacillus barcinonensis]|uniref:Accessory gene regulator B n=1 Tax=Paenibacillus barcinonensis TaxID=198119 RepID=A0A2V4VY78_PAEBA|nr:accessory gene regulator B family protein [Paenibacillus barcinonensis]PYE52474.1 accessory gene regulator B [Paenibacillus barcinonensis]QKS59363.1 accessory gene regulator B family protein [Paenibacillus barcinonensis]QKS59421.1 accessory gene regulator B family protein [Paenibacillus barcinonensis]